MSEPLADIAARIFHLAMGEYTYRGQVSRLGVGPVLTVVRDLSTGKIYVGFNTGVPNDLSNIMSARIAEHRTRIARQEIKIARTDPLAPAGGHSEINALNSAIRDREKLLGRQLGDMDLRVFELHNVWMGGSRTAIPDTAARCEHCGPLTRFVTVTQSLFRVEGGVIGEVNVPQRGSATPAGSTRARPVTTTSGEINVPQRGSVIPAGSIRARPVTTTSGSISPSPVGRLSGGQIGGAVLTVAGLIAGAVLTQYLYR